MKLIDKDLKIVGGITVTWIQILTSFSIPHGVQLYNGISKALAFFALIGPWMLWISSIMYLLFTFKLHNNFHSLAVIFCVKSLIAIMLMISLGGFAGISVSLCDDFCMDSVKCNNPPQFNTAHSVTFMLSSFGLISVNSLFLKYLYDMSPKKVHVQSKKKSEVMQKSQDSTKNRSGVLRSISTLNSNQQRLTDSGIVLGLQTNEQQIQTQQIQNHIESDEIDDKSPEDKFKEEGTTTYIECLVVPMIEQDELEEGSNNSEPNAESPRMTFGTRLKHNTVKEAIILE